MVTGIPATSPQYQSDLRNATASMNTSTISPPDLSSDPLPPITSPHSDISPQILSSHLMHAMPATAMHVPMPPAYMASALNVLDLSASAPPTASGFLPDFTPSQCDPFTITPSLESDMIPELSPSSHVSSGSPPQSQVPSPPVHVSAPSYAVGSVSSLASALDPTIVSGGRSRAGTSVSSLNPPSGFVPAAPSGQQNPSMSFSPSKSDEKTVVKVENSEDTHILNILESIAQTANSAGKACRLRDGPGASSKVDELKGLISLASRLMSMSLSDNQFSNPSPPMTNDYQSQPMSATSTAGQLDHALTFPPASVAADGSAMDLSGHLGISDQSRKRCASEVEEERIVKAPKREPQDDMPLLVPSTEGLFPVEAPTTFPSSSVSVSVVPAAVSTVPMPPNSATSSRPTTPPGLFGSHTSFSPIKHSSQPAMPLDYPSFVPSAPSTLPFIADRVPSPPLEFDSNIAAPIVVAPPTFPPILRSSWSDSVMPSQHQQRLSSGSTTGNVSELQGFKIAGPAATVAPTSIDTLSQHQLQAQKAPGANGTAAISPPLGRMSRSGSINGPFTNPFPFYSDRTPELGSSPWSKVGGTAAPTSAPPAPQGWFNGKSDASAPPASGSSASEVPGSASESPHTDDDGDADDDEEDTDGSPSRGSQQLPSADSPAGPSGGSDIPQEYRQEVDRIFFEYLNKICSNLDATDSKGEPIHQTLMAKKMQRLDESPDFRPFKFRIQAFTLAFLEELARQGYPEEKIPMKKVRNYLWRQQYILRFNEDGKKAKSKGNHIWNIEAKKAGDGKWEFRPFHRKLAGAPPGVAYVGLRWSWTPRIWDPQASWQNIPVQYSSPSLPSWLSWKDDVLSGTPPPDAESCKITVNAKFVLDGQEGILSHTFTLNMAPVSTIDTSFSSQARHPALDHTRRSSSDSVLSQAPQRPMQCGQPGAGPPNPGSSARVIQILQSAAQRVEQETHEQMIFSFSRKEGEIEDLVKQKHVLEQTVTAYGGELSGRTEGPQSQNRVLAVAAQNVVVQAAQTVIADRTAAIAGLPISPAQSTAMQQVTVNEVSVATQDAIAKAVKINGTSSTEVDIILTATSILHEQARAPGSPPGMLDVSQNPSTEPTRSHVVESLPPRPLPLLAAMPNTLPPPLPGLSEYPSLP